MVVTHEVATALAECEGGLPKNFLRACLLLLVKERPAHGYDLLERLGELGVVTDPGVVYRTLRTLEHEGLVHSAWEASPSGPARRTYELSWDGEERLAAWSHNLAATHSLLHVYLARSAAALGAGAAATSGGRP